MTATLEAHKARILAQHSGQEAAPARSEAKHKGRSYYEFPTGHPVSDSPDADLQAVGTAKRAHEASQSCFAKMTYGSSPKTKVAKAMVLGIAAGLATFFVLSNPVGWAVGVAAVAAAGVTAGIFVTSLVAMQVIHTLADNKSATQINRAFNPNIRPVSFKQMAEFQISGSRRLGKKNFNHVHTAANGKQIFLGAIPNQKDPNYLKRMNKAGVGAVLSVNEPWERHSFAQSVPFSRDDWNAAGKDYHSMDVLDHIYLNTQQLDEAADFIHDELQAGKSVYVHCKSGVGRSAMAIAAYLIKYEKMTPAGAAQQIQFGNEDKGIEGRKKSTIQDKFNPHEKKGEGLLAYEKHCLERAQQATPSATAE